MSNKMTMTERVYIPRGDPKGDVPLPTQEVEHLVGDR